MIIKLSRQNDAHHMRAENETGNTIDFDAIPELGGLNKGFRPMEALLSSLGACASVDVIAILKKQQQPLEDLNITMNGNREQGKTPAVFTDINVHFELVGNIEESKVERAVQLSMEKYCSVGAIIEKTAKITYSYEIKS